jgi:hypothetical protein
MQTLMVLQNNIKKTILWIARQTLNQYEVQGMNGQAEKVNRKFNITDFTVVIKGDISV